MEATAGVNTKAVVSRLGTSLTFNPGRATVFSL